MAENYHDLAQCLARALGYLLDSRGRQVHWGDVRSTALAIWALNEVVSGRKAESGSLPEIRQAIRDATAWLIGQARRENGVFSWESEAWDTSLAILALVSSRNSSERVDQATSWLERIRDEKSGVWYDEVWETTLATVALLRAERIRDKPTRDFSARLQAVLKWFVQIPSKDSGEFVCPHYSGFLAWILAEINASGVEGIRRNDLERFRKKTMFAVAWLLKTIANAPGWSSDTFSNAYICLGLSLLSESENNIDGRYRVAVTDWLRKKQGSSGSFEDTEDTALAILALSRLIHVHEDGCRAYQEMTHLVPRAACSTVRCFLGYCSSSKALALEIKDSLRHRMPSLQIMDWPWEFQLGKPLMPQIKEKSGECDVAVFLVTKDDQLVDEKSGRTLTDSPRDNVIFEVGFFAARLGFERTLLVVEEGTKLPDDWGGILHISFRDRDNLDRVNLALLDGIKEALQPDQAG